MQCAPTTAATTTTTFLVFVLFSLFFVACQPHVQQSHAHQPHRPLCQHFIENYKSNYKITLQISSFLLDIFSLRSLVHCHWMPLVRPMASLRWLCQRMRCCAERDSWLYVRSSLAAYLPNRCWAIDAVVVASARSAAFSIDSAVDFGFLFVCVCVFLYFALFNCSAFAALIAVMCCARVCRFSLWFEVR